MKRYFKYISIIAAAALAVVSCTKEIESNEIDIPSGKMKTISIRTSIDTKTTLDDNHNGIVWSSGDNISIFNDIDNTNLKCTYSPDVADLVVEVPEETEEIYAHYPWYGGNEAGPQKVSIYISNSQTQKNPGELNGYYYPMVAKGTVTSDNKALVKFYPVASALALNIYNTDLDGEETVSSVKVTPSSANTLFTGSQVTDLTGDNSIKYTSAANSDPITVTLTNPLSLGSTKPADKQKFEGQIYVCLAKQSYANVEFEIVTNKGTYTITSGNTPFDCVTNDFVPVNINLAKAEFESFGQFYTWDLSTDETTSASANALTWESTYANMKIEKGSASTPANNYYPGTEGKTYTSTRFYANSVLTLTPVIGYKVTKVLFTATSSSYANALSNSNWTNANAVVEGTSVIVTPVDGDVNISASIGGTCGFSSVSVYYETSSTEWVTSLEIANQPTKTEYYVGDHFNPSGIKVVLKYVSGTKEKVFDVTEDCSYDPELETPLALTDTEVIVSYSNMSVSVPISVSEPPSGLTYYVKVTSAADLTNGEYLIVYEEGSIAMNGGLADNLDAVGNSIGVVIDGNKIAVTNAVDAAAFTYDATAKTLKGAGGLFMGQTSDANGLASSATTAYENTISFDSDGNANIVSGGAYLRYNAASNQTRFRYYKSTSYTGQKAIALYKK